MNMRPSSALGEEAATLVRRSTGLVFSETRRSVFDAALAGAMRRAKLNDGDVYLARLSVEPALLDDLVADLTVGETYFFREPLQFEAIRNRVIPELLSHRPDRCPLRVWSAGCATGEEPYSLAIVLRELGLEGSSSVVATDLSRDALTQARVARYTRWSLRGVPDEVTRKYFARVDDRFELEPAVRAAVDFRHLNLAADTYPSLPSGVWGMDLILCRNVLIYFDAETVACVARRLMDSLADDGWLLLGASDPILSDLVPCDVIVTDAGLAYRRPGRGAHRSVAETTVARDIARPPIESRMEEPPPVSALPERRPSTTATERGTHGGDDVALQVARVRALANRGELVSAARACDAALEQHRASAELVHLHAMLLAEAGRHSDAAAAARRALYLDRGLIVAHLTLGSALARLDEADGARRAFRNAARLLSTLAPDAIVASADGECAGRLAEMARSQLQRLSEATA